MLDYVLHYRIGKRCLPNAITKVRIFFDICKFMHIFFRNLAYKIDIVIWDTCYFHQGVCKPKIAKVG